jgi:hypothetical protein
MGDLLVQVVPIMAVSWIDILGVILAFLSLFEGVPFF